MTDETIRREAWQPVRRSRIPADPHRRLDPRRLVQPLRWRARCRVVVSARNDIFAPDVPDAWLDRIHATMALCPGHRFQIDTRYPDRGRAYVQAILDEPDRQGGGDRWTAPVNAVLLGARRSWGECGSTSTSITTRQGSGAREPDMFMRRDGRLCRLTSAADEPERWWPVSPGTEALACAHAGHDFGDVDFAWGLKEWPLPNVAYDWDLPF